MAKSTEKRSNLSQLERVREIHRLIKRYTENAHNSSLRVTAEILARKLDVTDRQIRRDIDVLLRLIDEKDIERGRGGLENALRYDAALRSYLYTREIDLSVWVGRLEDEELGSLLVAQQALAVFSGMPLAKKLGHIFEEDAGGLVGNVRSTLRDDITQLVSFYPDGAGKIDQSDFATVFRGLLLQQKLEVSYQSKGRAKPIARVLHPYHLCCFKHQWRLIAYDSIREKVCDFVVTPHRLRAVKLLSESFDRPSDFDPAAHLSHRDSSRERAFTLRIAAAGVHHVLERSWQSLSAVKQLAGGAIEATFQISDPGEFKHFVLSFGRDCEVLAPADFREEILAHARSMLGIGSAQ